MFGASSVRVRCEFGASSVRVRCEFSTSSVRVQCEFGMSSVRAQCEFSAELLRIFHSTNIKIENYDLTLGAHVICLILYSPIPYLYERRVACNFLHHLQFCCQFHPRLPFGNCFGMPV